MDQKLTQAPYGLGRVDAFTVRPAVPPPAGSPEVEVDPRDVWEQVVAAGEVEAPWAMRDLLLEIRSRVRQGHLADWSAL